MNTQNQTLSIIIPVYNEEATLKTLYQRVVSVNFPLNIEIIMVDDCSKDRSRDIIAELATEDSRIKKVFKPSNGGKGSALHEGIKEATGDYVVIQDADTEYDPQDILTLLPKMMSEEADIVYGSRFSPMRTQVFRYYHYLGNRVLTTFSNFLTNIRLTDMETCYKMFRREIIQNIKLESMRYGFEPEVTAKVAKLNVRIYEFPISYNQRSYEEGKKIGIKDGFEALWCIFKYNIMTRREDYLLPSMPSKFLQQKGLYS